MEAYLVWLLGKYGSASQIANTHDPL